MEIRDSARKHGIADADIEHAWLLSLIHILMGEIVASCLSYLVKGQLLAPIPPVRVLSPRPFVPPTPTRRYALLTRQNAAGATGDLHPEEAMSRPLVPQSSPNGANLGQAKPVVRAI